MGSVLHEVGPMTPHVTKRVYWGTSTTEAAHTAKFRVVVSCPAALTSPAIQKGEARGITLQENYGENEGFMEDRHLFLLRAFSSCIFSKERSRSSRCTSIALGRVRSWVGSEGSGGLWLTVQGIQNPVWSTCQWWDRCFDNARN